MRFRLHRRAEMLKLIALAFAHVLLYAAKAEDVGGTKRDSPTVSGCLQPSLRLVHDLPDDVFVCDGDLTGWRRHSSCADQCRYAADGMTCSLRADDLRSCWLSTGDSGFGTLFNFNAFVDSCHTAADGLYLQRDRHALCRDGRKVDNVTDHCLSTHACWVMTSDWTLRCTGPVNPVYALFCAALNSQGKMSAGLIDSEKDLAGDIINLLDKTEGADQIQKSNPLYDHLLFQDQNLPDSFASHGAVEDTDSYPQPLPVVTVIFPPAARRVSLPRTEQTEPGDSAPTGASFVPGSGSASQRENLGFADKVPDQSLADPASLQNQSPLLFDPTDLLLMDPPELVPDVKQPKFNAPEDIEGVEVHLLSDDFGPLFSRDLESHPFPSDSVQITITNGVVASPQHLPAPSSDHSGQPKSPVALPPLAPGNQLSFDKDFPVSHTNQDSMIDLLFDNLLEPEPGVDQPLTRFHRISDVSHRDLSAGAGSLSLGLQKMDKRRSLSHQKEPLVRKMRGARKSGFSDRKVQTARLKRRRRRSTGGDEITADGHSKNDTNVQDKNGISAGQNFQQPAPSSFKYQVNSSMYQPDGELKVVLANNQNILQETHDVPVKGYNVLKQKPDAELSDLAIKMEAEIDANTLGGIKAEPRKRLLLNSSMLTDGSDTLGGAAETMYKPAAASDYPKPHAGTFIKTNGERKNEDEEEMNAIVNFKDPKSGNLLTERKTSGTPAPLDDQFHKVNNPQGRLYAEQNISLNLEHRLGFFPGLNKFQQVIAAGGINQIKSNKTTKPGITDSESPKEGQLLGDNINSDTSGKSAHLSQSTAGVVKKHLIPFIVDSLFRALAGHGKKNLTGAKARNAANHSFSLTMITEESSLPEPYGDLGPRKTADRTNVGLPEGLLQRPDKGYARSRAPKNQAEGLATGLNPLLDLLQELTGVHSAEVSGSIVHRSGPDFLTGARRASPLSVPTTGEQESDEAEIDVEFRIVLDSEEGEMGDQERSAGRLLAQDPALPLGGLQPFRHWPLPRLPFSPLAPFFLFPHHRHFSPGGRPHVFPAAPVHDAGFPKEDARSQDQLRPSLKSGTVNGLSSWPRKTHILRRPAYHDIIRPDKDRGVVAGRDQLAPFLARKEERPLYPPLAFHNRALSNSSSGKSVPMEQKPVAKIMPAVITSVVSGSADFPVPLQKYGSSKKISKATGREGLKDYVPSWGEAGSSLTPLGREAIDSAEDIRRKESEKNDQPSNGVPAIHLRHNKGWDEARGMFVHDSVENKPWKDDDRADPDVDSAPDSRGGLFQDIQGYGSPAVNMESSKKDAQERRASSNSFGELQASDGWQNEKETFGDPDADYDVYAKQYDRHLSDLITESGDDGLLGKPAEEKIGIANSDVHGSIRKRPGTADGGNLAKYWLEASEQQRPQPLHLKQSESNGDVPIVPSRSPPDKTKNEAVGDYLETDDILLISDEEKQRFVGLADVNVDISAAAEELNPTSTTQEMAPKNESAESGLEAALPGSGDGEGTQGSAPIRTMDSSTGRKAPLPMSGSAGSDAMTLNIARQSGAQATSDKSDSGRWSAADLIRIPVTTERPSSLPTTISTTRPESFPLSQMSFIFPKVKFNEEDGYKLKDMTSEQGQRGKNPSRLTPSASLHLSVANIENTALPENLLHAKGVDSGPLIMVPTDKSESSSPDSVSNQRALVTQNSSVKNDSPTPDSFPIFGQREGKAAESYMNDADPAIVATMTDSATITDVPGDKSDTAPAWARYFGRHSPPHPTSATLPGHEDQASDILEENSGSRGTLHYLGLQFPVFFNDRQPSSTNKELPGDFQPNGAITGKAERFPFPGPRAGAIEPTSSEAGVQETSLIVQTGSKVGSSDPKAD